MTLSQRPLTHFFTLLTLISFIGCKVKSNSTITPRDNQNDSDKQNEEAANQPSGPTYENKSLLEPASKLCDTNQSDEYKKTVKAIIKATKTKNCEDLVQQRRKILDLEICDENLSDISALKEFPNLKILDLSRNNIVDASVFKELKDIESLSLTLNNISDLKWIPSSSKLKDLTIMKNNIIDMDGIQNAKNIEDLNLSGNNLSDLEPLSNLINLTSLQISRTNVRDISSLRYLPKLDSYTSYWGQESDLSSLSESKSLKYIFVMSDNLDRSNPIACPRGEGVNQAISQFCTSHKIESQFKGIKGTRAY